MNVINDTQLVSHLKKKIPQWFCPDGSHSVGCRVGRSHRKAGATKTHWGSRQHPPSSHACPQSRALLSTGIHVLLSF